jgi:DNA-binding response OmpR family regulator
VASTIGLVLVVDDECEVRAAIRDVLIDHGFLVVEAASGTEAKEQLTQHEPDVILLDLGLPDVSGLDILSDLTESNSIPVIVISGRAGETDTVVGLNLGADDYIAKPFSTRELVARVNAAVRRSRRQGARPTMRFGSLCIDEDTHDIILDGAPVKLTPKEFDLLVFLARSPRHVYDRRQLLQHVWGSSPNWQDDNTVAEHIRRIRKKLDPDHRSRWIETVRGVGYRFVPPS